jgi:hypothetical protein
VTQNTDQTAAEPSGTCNTKYYQALPNLTKGHTSRTTGPRVAKEHSFSTSKHRFRGEAPAVCTQAVFDRDPTMSRSPAKRESRTAWSHRVDRLVLPGGCVLIRLSAHRRARALHTEPAAAPLDAA